MRRVARHLFTLCSAASLLLCAAACVLGVRNRDRPDGSADQISARNPRTGDRLTLRCEPGGLVLLAPPTLATGVPVTRAPDGQTAESIVASLSDADVKWGVAVGFRWPIVNGRRVKKPAAWKDGPYPLKRVRPLLAGTSFAYPVRRGTTGFPEREVLPPLLRALEDPARAPAAHVLLATLSGRDGTTWQPRWPDPFEAEQDSWEARPDGSYVQVFAGLRAGLTVDPKAPVGEESTPGGRLRHYRCVARVDPAQWPGIRAAWHRRLDVPVASAAYGSLAAGAAALPLAWLASRTWRRMARRHLVRSGRCPACGYDLRASAGRCPECGAAAVSPP